MNLPWPCLYRMKIRSCIYKIIADFAIQKMKAGGALFLEIHHDYAHKIMDWYADKGFALELKKDLFGNNRMIKAWR